MTYTKADEVIVRAIELQQAADEIIEDGHMHTHHLARLRSASERLDDAIAAEALKPPEPDAALARIEALEREREAALADARRWRYAMGHCKKVQFKYDRSGAFESMHITVTASVVSFGTGREVSREIDAALAAQEGAGHHE